MTSFLRREVLIPLLLVVVGGGAYVAQPWANDPAPARQTAPRAADQAKPGDPVADIRLDLLTPAEGTVSTVTRNPFRFQERIAPPPEPGSGGGGGRRIARQPEFEAPPIPTGPPPPPPITLRFIGLIEAPPQSGRVALLSDGRGGLMHGREGDTVDGRYRMLRVGPDSIEMAYVDGRGRQTIRLSGQ